MLRTGPLNRRLQIETRSTSQDSYGEQVHTWSLLTTVWGSVMAMSARERFAAQAVQSSATHQVRIRYQPQFANPQVVAAMRIVMAKDGVNRVFNILGAMDEDETRKYLLLDVEEGLNQG